VEQLVTVKEFMSAPPITLNSDASIADACRLMGEKHIGSILLSRRGVIDAIFTERDLVSKALSEKANLALIKIANYASSPLITVSPTTDVKEAARIMTEMRVRRLVVIENGKPIGIFAAADLAKAVGKEPLEI
jgi:CBS domain-containing protein